MTHQINRSAKAKARDTKGTFIPSHLDLRDGSVEDDAAVVLVLHRKERYMEKEKVGHEERNIMTINVSKNRYGLSKMINVGFDPRISRVIEE